MQNGQVIDEFASDVNPHQELDDHIIHLIGITDQQLAQAPDFSEIARTIFELIGDCIFYLPIMLNLTLNLLAEALFMEGFELRTPRVDTVELAQRFIQTLEQYKLSHLSKVLNLDSFEPIPLLKMRERRTALFHLMDKIASLPRQTIEMLLTFSDNLLLRLSWLFVML